MRAFIPMPLPCLLMTASPRPCLCRCAGAHLSGLVDSSSHDAKTATPHWPPSTVLAPKAPSTGGASWLSSSRASWIILAAAISLMMQLHSCQQQKRASFRRMCRKKKIATNVKRLSPWVRRDSDASTKWRQCFGMVCLLLLPHGHCAAYALASAPTESRPPTAPPSPDRVSTSVAKNPQGTAVVTHGRPLSDAMPLVLHGRTLSQVSVSTVDELVAAVSDSAVDKIVVAAGRYEFSSSGGCSGSALCISREVTIEAEVAGSVVFDGMGARRVFRIESGGTAELIGLNITGGAQPARLAHLSNLTDSVLAFCNFHDLSSIAPLN